VLAESPSIVLEDITKKNEEKHVDEEFPTQCGLIIDFDYTTAMGAGHGKLQGLFGGCTVSINKSEPWLYLSHIGFFRVQHHSWHLQFLCKME
jgi:hypothetical protein